MSRVEYRFLLIPATLLLSAAAALLITPNNYYLFFGLIVAVGAALVMLRYPPLGLVGIIIFGQFVPWGLGTGTNTTLNPAMLILAAMVALVILRAVIAKDPPEWVLSHTFLPLVVLLVVVIIATLVGQFHWFTASPAPIRAQLGGAALFFFTVFAYMITAQTVVNIRWLEALTWILLGCGAFYLTGFHLIGAYLPSLGSRLAPLFTRGASGAVLWVWLSAFCFAQLLFNPRADWRMRVGAGGLLAAVLFVRMKLALSWTSGWLPVIITLAVMVWVGFPKLRPYAVFVAVGALLFASKNFIDVILSGNQYSLGTRLAAWKILGQIILVEPIFGVGPANYYNYTPLFRIMGYAVKFNSHNNYIDLVAQVGLAGLACYFWFFWESLRLGWRLLKTVPDGFPRAYVIACLGGAVGTMASGMLGDWVIPFVYNIGFAGFRASVLGWMFLGGLVALDYWVKKGQLKPTESG